MPAVSANTAAFHWGTGSTPAALADVESISDVSINGAEIDVSKFGTDKHRDFLAGKFDYSFTIGVLLNRTSHQTIVGDMLGRDVRNFELRLVDGRFTGSGFITSVSASASIDDAVRATISVRGTGALTYAANA
jgi:predicted secreted protein